MKLASLKSGRDGQLVVVSRDLARAAHAAAIAPTLQAALDRWRETAGPLAELSAALDADRIPSFAFDESSCAAPLPRAFQWADGSAYVNHVELLRRSRNESLPESFWREPLIYQGGSDTFLGPHEPIRHSDADWGIDFEAEIAVVTDDVPVGTRVEQASGHIVLYMLANDVSLRRLIPPELEKGFGFFVGKPATSFSPVAVTPDELGAGLVNDRIRYALRVDLNSRPFGRARPDVDQVFTMPQLLAHATQTRALCAGTILGGGTVSNKSNGEYGLPVDEGGAGYSCIAELRAVETIRHGRPRTPFMQAGDRVTIAMRDDEGRSIFGRIDQRFEVG